MKTFRLSFPYLDLDLEWALASTASVVRVYVRAGGPVVLCAGLKRSVWIGARLSCERACAAALARLVCRDIAAAVAIPDFTLLALRRASTIY